MFFIKKIKKGFFGGDAVPTIEADCFEGLQTGSLGDLVKKAEVPDQPRKGWFGPRKKTPTAEIISGVAAFAAFAEMSETAAEEPPRAISMPLYEIEKHRWIGPIREDWSAPPLSPEEEDEWPIGGDDFIPLKGGIRIARRGDYRAYIVPGDTEWLDAAPDPDGGGVWWVAVTYDDLNAAHILRGCGATQGFLEREFDDGWFWTYWAGRLVGGTWPRGHFPKATDEVVECKDGVYRTLSPEEITKLFRW